jgi:hypothetical protein
MKRTLPLIFFSLTTCIFSQQNQQLYLMHYLPESNFLNPAVQTECKWFIGLPVISSIHFNYANSALSYKSVFAKGSDGAYHPETAKIDKTVRLLGRRSFIGAEFHTTLFALGYRHDYDYFNFSIIEKINAPATFPREPILLAWKGNSQFEGENARFKGTASYATYYREYALGYSTLNRNGNFSGIKAKLLFGKLNISNPPTKVSLYTDKNTFDLTLSGEATANISAPVIITQNGNRINGYEIDHSKSISQLLLNRKNWGVAFDLGIIHEYSDKITLSASILDVGFIRWRSNITNAGIFGNYNYQGIPFDSINASNFFDNLLNSYNDSIQYIVTHNAYTTVLPIKIYGGANYIVSEKLNAHLVLSGVWYQTKLLTAATLGLDYNPFRNFHLVGSYSLMYRSFKIVGLGLSMGKGPVQFYAITDNVFGFIWPLSTRNINLRFGLNINLGCNIRKSSENARAKSSIEDACKVFDKSERWNKKKTGRHK